MILFQEKGLIAGAAGKAAQIRRYDSCVKTEVAEKAAGDFLLSKEQIISLLKEAAFDVNEYWVTSGAAMVLYGIKDLTRDIDLGCTSRMADQLEKEGYCANVLGDGSRKIVFSETIELFENWVEDQVVLLEGLPVVSMDGMVMMKEKLGREKDLQDIFLINEFRNSMQ